MSRGLRRQDKDLGKNSKNFRSKPLKLKVRGFSFSGIHAGLKENQKKDLGLIVSEESAHAVAYFTTNRLKAAPVIQGQRVIRGGKLRAVVINSGNANAVTGPRGLKDALGMARSVGKGLGLSPEQVLVSSTGKIGVPLDMKKILGAVPKLIKSLSPTNLNSVAQAIRTTDQFIKVHQVKGKIGGKPYHFTGIAKGAGMIEPNMATMLAYILTDLDISRPLLKKMTRQIVNETFNAITVDGDMSTNDTVLFLANGSSNLKIANGRSLGFKKIREGMREVCEVLANKIVRDGEGATKVVTLKVKGAKSHRAAQRIAYRIGRSQLVKTSFFGEDPNWGRIFCALGYSGEPFEPGKVDIAYGDVYLVRKGRPTSVKLELKAHKVMKKDNFSVSVHLNQGKGEAQILTSDLTYEYVKINAEYRT